MRNCRIPCRRVTAVHKERYALICEYGETYGRLNGGTSLDIRIRLEEPEDYRIVEELTREAFWGSMDHPACDGEHLLVHKLRKLPCFVPELDFVAEAEGRIVGHVIYSRAKIVTEEGKEIEILSFGPLSVLPEYKGRGVGSALMRHSIDRAGRLGYRAIVFYGHPDYYPRFGFRRAARYGITAPDGGSFDALMAMELYDGALKGISGRCYEDEVYQTDPEEVAEFDKTFPLKEPARLMPIEALTAGLPEKIRQAFVKRGIRYVGSLYRFSGVEILRWEGMDEEMLAQMNDMLAGLGIARKLLPSSHILQLAEMGVRNPLCSLIRTKEGISLYRVESEGRKMVLKVFRNPEDRREIDNYNILKQMKIQTLPLLKVTESAILLPDVEADGHWRLGRESDLSDPKTARALAEWYRGLHEKGRLLLAERARPKEGGMRLPESEAVPFAGENNMQYDESDMITMENMRSAAEKTGTSGNELWKAAEERFDVIRSRIDALPRTVVYNDFHWTNLIVAKDGESAFMFDYNLLGKGSAFGDIRNVTGALSKEAAEAFREKYFKGGYDREEWEEQRKADAFSAPVVTLIAACNREKFPSWAEDSLRKLKNGDVLRALEEWL